jgi:hypothetical protein
MKVMRKDEVEDGKDARIDCSDAKSLHYYRSENSIH